MNGPNSSVKTREITAEELYKMLQLAAQKVVDEGDPKLVAPDFVKYPFKDPTYGTIMDANEEMWAATDYWKKFFEK